MSGGRRAPTNVHSLTLMCPGTDTPVVLRDWSFVELVVPSKSGGLGFRAIGTLVIHPRIPSSKSGESLWHSTEIQGIFSNGVVVSCNMTLYRLDGPAKPALHGAPPALIKIMDPFCQSVWPSNDKALFQIVSTFFASVKQQQPVKSTCM